MTNGNDALDPVFRDRILRQLSAKAGINHLVTECQVQAHAARDTRARERFENFKQTDFTASSADAIVAAARRVEIGY